MVERMRLQRERVDVLTQALEQLRDEIINARANRPRLLESIKELESKKESERDATRREQIETELKELKYSLDQQSQLEERQTNKEAQLNTQLEAERAKLDDLEKRLDALERELERQQ